MAGSAATFFGNTNFLGAAVTVVGTNVVPVIARDLSSNKRTNNYEVVVTNNGVAKILSYDLNGNLGSVVSATNTTTYTWDAGDRLINISQFPSTGPTVSSEFTYDGLERRTRIVERTNGVVQSDKRFVWCGTELCEERDATGATVNKRFFGQGEQISGTAYFFTRDHLGSVREMTDSAGTVQARYEFDPYGRRAKVSGSLDSDFAFTGHYYHQASGLHLALYRAYDADTARWLSRDPIRERRGLNLYPYAENNPVGQIDLFGAEAERAEVTVPYGFGYKVIAGDNSYKGTVENGNVNALATFVNTLQQVGNSGGTIERLHLYGHGSTDARSLGDLFFGTVRPAYEASDQKYLSAGDLKKLLGPIMNDSTSIYLEFCHSAESPEISDFFSDLVPNITVYGVTGERNGIQDYGPLVNRSALRRIQPSTRR